MSCDSGYALEGDDKTFEFVCEGGQFVAAGDGPQCLSKFYFELHFLLKTASIILKSVFHC